MYYQLLAEVISEFTHEVYKAEECVSLCMICRSKSSHLSILSMFVCLEDIIEWSIDFIHSLNIVQPWIQLSKNEQRPLDLLSYPQAQIRKMPLRLPLCASLRTDCLH